MDKKIDNEEEKKSLVSEIRGTLVWPDPLLLNLKKYKYSLEELKKLLKMLLSGKILQEGDKK